MCVYILFTFNVNKMLNTLLSILQSNNKDVTAIEGMLGMLINKMAYLDYGGCDYGECDPNPNPYLNSYPYPYPNPYPNTYPKA